MMRRCKMHGVVPTQATFVGRVAGETHQLLVELDDRQLHHNTSSPESASRNTSPVTSFILAADRTLIQVAGCGCETLALDSSGKVPALVSPSRSSTYPDGPSRICVVHRSSNLTRSGIRIARL